MGLRWWHGRWPSHTRACTTCGPRTTTSPSPRRLEPVRGPDAGAVSDAHTVAAAMRGHGLWANVGESGPDGSIFRLHRGRLRPLRAGQFPHGLLQPTGPGV